MNHVIASSPAFIRQVRWVVLSLVVSYVCFACNQKASFKSPEKIGVTWKLVTNFTDSADVFDAEFTLQNNSDEVLESNWNLFFNMAPRPILKNRVKQAAIVEHINGDWYKMVPEPDFRLEPGKSVVIAYRGTEAVIKDTDRPLGLYVVFYDGKGNQQEIATVSDYSFAEFSQSDQVTRRKDDFVPLPTPEWLYNNNRNIKDVDLSRLSPVVPTPVAYRRGVGYYLLDEKTTIVHASALSGEAKFLKETLQAMGVSVQVAGEGATTPTGPVIRLSTAPSNVKAKESYSLTVKPSRIDIVGADASGVFYGIQSLRMMMPVESLGSKQATIRIPAIAIEDAPRFGFRSVHVDVSRNFQTKESVMRMLDVFALYKINHMLLYVTEDEGWRLEIDGLPELTETGSRREHCSGMDAPVLHPAYGSGPFAGQEGTFGSGYYSKADFIEILRYANDRHITIIPEVNFPGHARAAIKAMEARYQRLMKEGKPEAAEEYRLVDPDDKSVYLSAQGYKDNVVCVARESVFHFYEKVLDEITKMYQDAGLKLEVFHTGGDEVPEGSWTKSPMADALLKEHPEISDPKNLQMWFFQELVKRLKPRNLQLHGWEEIALTKGKDGKLHPNNDLAQENVVPYIWNNLFDPDLSYRLANAGFRIVLCNVTNFYFDLGYNKDPREPGLYWAGFVNERNAWAFAPFDLTKTTTRDGFGKPLNLVYDAQGAAPGAVVIEALKPEARANILGVEAQLWSETVKGRPMLEYYVLPKLMGFAESAWAPERKWETIDSKAARDKAMDDGWNAFANILGKRELPRLGYLNGGYNYRVPVPGVLVENGVLKANTEYPGLEIRYTLDGSEPTKDSPLYTREMVITKEVILRSFDSSGKGSRSVNIKASRAE